MFANILAHFQINTPVPKPNSRNAAGTQSKPKKNNIARTILNIFGSHTHSSNSSKGSEESLRIPEALEGDSGSAKSGRRPSVDTVSTYLSHDTASRVSVLR